MTSPIAPAGAAEVEAAVPAGSTITAARMMTEAQLEQGVRRILKDLPSVLAYHTHDSRHSASGYPDWCFCGPDGLMFRELKREGKRPTIAQDMWLAALRGVGQSADVWYPADLLSGRVARELGALAWGGAT
jgi:hypothetical protein